MLYQAFQLALLEMCMLTSKGLAAYSPVMADFSASGLGHHAAASGHNITTRPTSGTALMLIVPALRPPHGLLPCMVVALIHGIGSTCCQHEHWETIRAESRD